MAGGHVAELRANGARTAPPSSAWRTVAFDALRTWFATRLAFVALTYFAVAFLVSPHGGSLGEFVRDWFRWDAAWYYLISRYGYFAPQTANFFPLYPAAVEVVTAALGHAHAAAGHLGAPKYPIVATDPVRMVVALAVANAAAALAFVGVALLGFEELRTEAAALRTVFVAAAYPLAFFLAAPYAEAIFVACIAFALLFARQGRWWSCAAVAFAAGLTRPISVILVAPLVYEFARQQRWWARGGEERRLPTVRSLAQGAAVALAMPAGLAVYALYLWRTYGNPLMFSYTQNHIWYHRFQLFWTTAAQQLHDFQLPSSVFGSQMKAMAVVDVASVLLVLGIALVAARRQPFAFTLLLIGLVAVTTVDPRTEVPDTLAGVSRYMTGAVPAYVAVAGWLENRPALGWGLAAVSFALQGAFTVAFLLGPFRVQVF